LSSEIVTNFNQVQQVKQDMGTIRTNIIEITALHGKIITEVSQQKTKGAG
jgi:hypothetical protein